MQHAVGDLPAEVLGDLVRVGLLALVAERVVGAAVVPLDAPLPISFRYIALICE